MTRQEGVAVLLIIALTTVTPVTGAGPIPLTPEEEAQRDDAAADMANLPAEDHVMTVFLREEIFVSEKMKQFAVEIHYLVATDFCSTKDLCFREDESSSVFPAGMYDIGKTINGTMTPSQIHDEIQKMPVEDKFMLLKHHSVPTPNHTFPSSYTGGCYRSFKQAWLKEHPWMVYSTHLDGAYCMSCVLFCNDRQGKGIFINKPFTAWQKRSEKCREHEKTKYHQDSLQVAESCLAAYEKPEKNIQHMIDEKKAANRERNRAVVRNIADIVLLCARQCIALRGDSEQPDSTGNPGNFLSILRFLSKRDPVMKEHLDSPAMRNATYMSPQTQNEVIDILAKDIVLANITREVQEAKFFAVLADEISSHNSEHLALCVRFVDKDSCIREEFLKFLPLQRITGENVAREILQALEDVGLNSEDIRGQGYDGAPNMSSGKVGVQARIKEVAPLATYSHCGGHCLNLVISHSSSIPNVRNVVDKLKHCCRFFQNSPKKEGLLDLIAKTNTFGEGRRKVLLDLCRTRWAERHGAYQHFYTGYTFLVEALEVIGFRLYEEEYSEYQDWDPGNRSEAQQILSSITSFELIITFLTIYQYLSHLSGITIKLQNSALDIIQAHSMVAEVQEFYLKEREKVTESFQLIYDQAVRMAEKVGVQPSKPRISQRQKHRGNAPAETVFDHYKVNVAIPFLEHISNNLNAKFSGLSTTASSLLGLLPSVICEREMDVTDIVSTYEKDLPSPELVPLEVRRWENRFDKVPETERPNSPALAIKKCDPDVYPNLYVLLKLACTIPVTSCECERSASALRRLNTYMRASMSKMMSSKITCSASGKSNNWGAF
ncbi:52 kDa repressor of the inhibitor of the protein kinase-like [Lingula anatina]|uniref:52 kDa repressor of the inhibitor of the protein kinase-like n=1 Tax=Lingula anatina TaxID=7574 RepID=A0A1S3KGL2_LINAN|nr:52 kDa repressor of the inhibitor of the protein kinase-like [Lingula anatina]|eukprot:XP_013421627.1 52 kDa repressor of the inhibitor of the protein kinase-like [Lingula anatina]